MAGCLSIQQVKCGLVVVALGLGVGLGFWVARRSGDNPMPYRFGGYQYSATMRFAVLSITNLRHGSIECLPSAELEFADGWEPKWGKTIVFLSTPTIKGGASTNWIFEVPPHASQWRVVCRIYRHSPVETLMIRLSTYRLLAWTESFAKPQLGAFATGWISE